MRVSLWDQLARDNKPPSWVLGKLQTYWRAMLSLNVTELSGLIRRHGRDNRWTCNISGPIQEEHLICNNVASLLNGPNGNRLRSPLYFPGSNAVLGNEFQERGITYFVDEFCPRVDHLEIIELENEKALSFHILFGTWLTLKSN